MVLAEDSRGTGAVIPRRVNSEGWDRMIIFLVSFAYLIGWIEIIGITVPATKNGVPSILFRMQWKVAKFGV